MKSDLELLKKQCIIFSIKAPQDSVSQSQVILQRVAKKGRGWAFTPHDFADLWLGRSCETPTFMAALAEKRMGVWNWVASAIGCRDCRDRGQAEGE
jgi:hypothetical protein